jgi:hypothetical protein
MDDYVQHAIENGYRLPPSAAVRFREATSQQARSQAPASIYEEAKQPS